MTSHKLREREWSLIRGVLSKHSEISGAILFGSRAKGVATPSSDVDLALEGVINPLHTEAVASELEELPLPYRFDIKALSAIQSARLREHIARVGVRVYG